MWLVRDRGFANHLGHGLGEVAGSEKKLDFKEQLQLLRSEPLIDVGAIRGPEMNYHLSRFPNSDDYAVIIEFSHARAMRAFLLSANRLTVDINLS